MQGRFAHTPQPETRRADPDREPVPVAGDAERKLPDARRVVAGLDSAFLGALSVPAVAGFSLESVA